MKLQQAAAHYAKMLYPGASESNANYTGAKSDFISGAEWQKEQYKLLCTLAFQAANICDNEGDVALCDKIKTELERLQD